MQSKVKLTLRSHIYLVNISEWHMPVFDKDLSVASYFKIRTAKLQLRGVIQLNLNSDVTGVQLAVHL